VRLLLDTHVALWAIVDSPVLPTVARGMIADPDNEVMISAASIWEIAIKHQISRGRPDAMPISGEQALEHFQAGDFRLLAITAAHAAAVDRLPLHHRDPFDRLLVAQALVEPLRLVTHDDRLQAYSDTIILI